MCIYIYIYIYIISKYTYIYIYLYTCNFFCYIYGRPQCNLVGIKRSYPFRYLLSRHALLIVASSASSGTPNAPYKSLSRSTASWSNIFSDFKANFVLSALRFPSSACPSCWQVSLHRYPTHADLHHQSVPAATGLAPVCGCGGAPSSLSH